MDNDGLPSGSRASRAADWCFRNRQTGRITIGQWPNASLILFAILAGADAILRPGGAFGTALRLGSAAALIWWATDELVRGVNPWRRCLGAGVLAYQLVALWSAYQAG